MISRSLWTLWTVGNSDDILTVLCCPSLALCKCLSIGTKLKSSKPCEVPPVIDHHPQGIPWSKLPDSKTPTGHSWSFLVDHAWKLMTWYSCYAFKSKNFWCPTQSRSLRDLPVPSSNSPKSFLSSLKAGHLQPPTFSVRSWNIPSPAFIILLASQPEITTKSPFFFPLISSVPRLLGPVISQESRPIICHVSRPRHRGNHQLQERNGREPWHDIAFSWWWKGIPC